jgi:hypothetical protein
MCPDRRGSQVGFDGPKGCGLSKDLQQGIYLLTMKIVSREGAGGGVIKHGTPTMGIEEH